MSPYDARLSGLRWCQFLAETAADPWWADWEAAFNEATGTAWSATLFYTAGIAGRPIVRLSSLPPGCTLMVGDQVYVPQPGGPRSWLRRLAAWLDRRMR